MRKDPRRAAAPKQYGYVLLCLLLIVSLLTIAAVAIAPSIAFQIKRDREEELIHRGVQYARAVRRYSKETGQFPSRFEQLQDFSGRRYLRRVYKDPITGQDFQPVYTSDIAMAAAAATRLKSPTDDPGSESSSDGLSPVSAETSGDNQTHPPNEIIFGVVSKSKDSTIREFGHLNHYNQWLFFYEPQYDRGLQLNSPTSLVPVAAGQAPTDSTQGQAKPAGEQQTDNPAPTDPPAPQ